VTLSVRFLAAQGEANERGHGVGLRAGPAGRPHADESGVRKEKLAAPGLVQPNRPHADGGQVGGAGGDDQARPHADGGSGLVIVRMRTGVGDGDRPHADAGRGW